MSTSSLIDLAPQLPTVSFELFPPRGTESDEAVWARILRMAEAGPDFFTVTYGASGSARESSDGIVHRLLTETAVPVVAHLTCAGATREELAARVRSLLDAGVRDFLALRGDPPAGQTAWVPAPGGVAGSADLVRLIREVQSGHPAAPDVTVAVAAYPSGHNSGVGEIAALLAKQAVGADYAITQVFYDAEAYATLVRDARAAGVTLPIVPGILPLTERRRLARLEELTGVPVPVSLDALLDVQDDAVRLRRGLDATLALIDRVLAVGAPGLHLYTFNRDRPALDVLDHLRARGVVNPALVGSGTTSAPPLP
ncbi:5,10-methylenetetrahydrofolate reductase [Georgenia sp. SUBG003]|uniref:methylenetetrahydrofolate reductase n=1 Tax=Georgenia sp. SUBG003 TaxID=1497974 RepID=UPI0006950331